VGVRRMIGQALRRLSAKLYPLIAYASLVFGRHRKLSADAGQVIEVRQRGSDVTVVSFAGIAALHGGMVNFEFTELLRKLSWEPNVVFVRDPLCACYHLRPDGSTGGLDYYAEQVAAAVRSTGATHVVAIGTSMGGMAALTFGTRLGFDQVLAFSPTWPLERYFLERGFRARLGRLELAIRKPAVYVERILLAQMARISYKRLVRSIGSANILDLEGELAKAAKLPKITLFHGRGCEPDAATADAIRLITNAETIPLDTAMHNSSGYLKHSGGLVPAILGRVEAHRREPAVVESGIVRAATPRRDRSSEAPRQAVSP